MSDPVAREAFFTLHRDLPREGPGLAEDVLWALKAWGGQGRRLADAACGPGADTTTLARACPEAQIEAVDLQPHFLDAARARLAAAGPRVTFRQADLRDLTGPLDFIWCAGAVYLVGIAAALSAWRSCLAPDGAVAFSHPVRLSRSRKAAEFWEGAGPIGTADSIAAEIASAGYVAHATRPVMGPAWEAYYAPMEARIAALRPNAGPELTRVLDAATREIALWRAAPSQIAYLLILAVPV